jgi:hypothetical protein
MKWFQLQSDSIGALKLVVVCLVATWYLFSIPNKSRDGKRITGLFALHLLAHLFGFFSDSVLSTQAEKYILVLQDCTFSLADIYTLWFIYTYHENYFSQEMRQMLILNAFLFIVALFFQPTTFKWTGVLSLLIFVWSFIVLSRKMIVRSLLAKGINQNDGFFLSTHVNNQSLRKTLMSEFLHSTDRTTKAYRALPYGVLPILLWCLTRCCFFTVFPTAINIGCWFTMHSFLPV